MFLFHIAGFAGLAFMFFVVYHLVRKQKAPITKADRVLKARALWAVLTREDEFGQLFEQIKEEG